MTLDAIVIGSGQAGVPLSHALAKLGWKIALIEKGPLGGTCVNTGCTPTKTMIHRAQVAHYARNAARWGVTARDVCADLREIVGQKEQMVQRWRDRSQQSIDRDKNIVLYRGEGKFSGPHAVHVNGELLESERIFINTGSRPRIPDIPGLNEVDFLTSETILNLTDLPGHLLVAGGGYVGLEFAQMFARFGSRVTVIQDDTRIVPREDPEITAALQAAMETEGITFELAAKIMRVERSGKSVKIIFEQGSQSSILASHLLIATGRQPNSEILEVGIAGLLVDKHGFISVNHRLETNVPGIWALGDVNGGPAFTHIAYNDYQIAYGNIVEKKALSTKDRLVPYCIFTDPQLAGFGWTEAEASARGYHLKIGKVPMASVARAIERGESAGLMKIVVNAADDRILGATILGVDAGEIIHILYTLALAHLPYTFLKGAVFIHPTIAEGLWFLMDAVAPVTRERR